MNDRIIVLKNIMSLVTDTTKDAAGSKDLFIMGNRIGKIVETGTVPYPQDASVIDCSHHVVLPGLVNTHHHFYQTLTRNHPRVQNVELFDWLTFLYNVWKYIDEEAVYYSTLLAVSELARTGCTLTTDHHYLYPEDFHRRYHGDTVRGRGETRNAFQPDTRIDVPEPKGWRPAARQCRTDRR